MRVGRDLYSRSVFINCPFDDRYWPLFEALVFTVLACGFEPRCSLEEYDSGTVRLDKIKRLIRACGLAVHDLSRVESNRPRALPRFNMPFELGLDIGCRSFGRGRLRGKRLLVLDAERYRYQSILSDISGQDIHTHRDPPQALIRTVRDWLRTAPSRRRVPGPLHIQRSYRQFARWLPDYCRKSGLDRRHLLFADYAAMAREWIEAAREVVAA